MACFFSLCCACEVVLKFAVRYSICFSCESGDSLENHLSFQKTSELFCRVSVGIGTRFYHVPHECRGATGGG